MFYTCWHILSISENESRLNFLSFLDKVLSQSFLLFKIALIID